jgi:hypothetical protein
MLQNLWVILFMLLILFQLRQAIKVKDLVKWKQQCWSLHSYHDHKYVDKHYTSRQSSPSENIRYTGICGYFLILPIPDNYVQEKKIVKVTFGSIFRSGERVKIWTSCRPVLTWIPILSRHLAVKYESSQHFA